MTDPMELVERLEKDVPINLDWPAAARLEIIKANVERSEAAARIRELVEWRPIETFDGCGQARPAIVAVPTKEGAWIVGEAWLRAEEEGATYDNGWWWAGTGPDDYHDSPIYEMSHHRGGPTHWLPLPSPPADRGGV
ncbi:hypothetical protein [Brevundimonas nasdae]|uniref:DUF551 domain-containing protein n=1 Tax=Brevundimonas nasdae TaxID=172043 RepID=A0ABX8TK29_9CAUL|nr:hypothetical protein [Brevundimonas nasdae]QYC11034.1 hypothetical protein KWG56_03210 [Brevundimonas nasdae]QYC13820.1 hypothetical protein KWG63_16760 [Brevundimonas nasdae]